MLLRISACSPHCRVCASYGPGVCDYGGCREGFVFVDLFCAGNKNNTMNMKSYMLLDTATFLQMQCLHYTDTNNIRGPGLAVSRY